jgi:hypothetical protein
MLSIFAAGLAHSVLPRYAFGVHDVAIRAAIAGIVAGVTSILILTLNNRRRSH